MWFVFRVSCFFVIFLVEVHSRAFLQNPIQTLSSSIWTASAQSDPSNISDLRTRKSDKLQQLSKYQDEEEEGGFADDPDGDVTNEAVPGIFQKKIEKIMRKLSFVAQLINRFSPTTNTTPENDEKVTEADDFDLEFDSDEAADKTEDVDLDKGNNTEIDESGAYINGRHGRLLPDNGKAANVEREINVKNTNQRGNIGVHFMEVLGSLFGLLYGAAIQLTNTTTSKPHL